MSENEQPKKKLSKEELCEYIKKHAKPCPPMDPAVSEYISSLLQLSEARNRHAEACMRLDKTRYKAPQL